MPCCAVPCYRCPGGEPAAPITPHFTPLSPYFTPSHTILPHPLPCHPIPPVGSGHGRHLPVCAAVRGGRSSSSRSRSSSSSSSRAAPRRRRRAPMGVTSPAPGRPAPPRCWRPQQSRGRSRGRAGAGSGQDQGRGRAGAGAGAAAGRRRAGRGGQGRSRRARGRAAPRGRGAVWCHTVPFGGLELDTNFLGTLRVLPEEAAECPSPAVLRYPPPGLLHLSPVGLRRRLPTSEPPGCPGSGRGPWGSWRCRGTAPCPALRQTPVSSPPAALPCFCPLPARPQPCLVVSPSFHPGPFPLWLFCVQGRSGRQQEDLQDLRAALESALSWGCDSQMLRTQPP